MEIRYQAEHIAFAGTSVVRFLQAEYVRLVHKNVLVLVSVLN